MHLVLILCTRSPTKTYNTICRLHTHLRKFAQRSKYAKEIRAYRELIGQGFDWKDIAKRVHFLGTQADLCDLKSVYALADQFKNGTVGRPQIEEAGDGGLKGIKVPRLDVAVLNAGIGGWTGIDWATCIPRVTLHMIRETTWPTYKISGLGVLTKPQHKYSDSKVQLNDEKQPLLNTPQEKMEEPPLGEVFCSNVFGHYILGHELMPVLSVPSSPEANHGGKIIWISTIGGPEGFLSLHDIQGLQSTVPYESSKRLTDLLCLTANLPSVKRLSAPYFDFNPVKQSNSIEKEKQTQYVKPRFFTTQPGIFLSDIMPLPFIMACFWKLTIFIVNLLGSPWHPVTPYKAAVAPVWVALTPDPLLDVIGGTKIKWGSGSTRLGDGRVKMTEVHGWGFNGEPDKEMEGERHIGRHRHAVDLTPEAREDFEIMGAKCWQYMEELRKEWEVVLGIKAKTS